ncbi:polymyxin B resistance protein pmrD [Enterobacter asburiae]|jgi:signal transduction protein PmrD|nr:polymyxin B resistance protein pmrD [Enterobacter asburiae]
MEWLVIEVFYLRNKGSYVLILQASSIKMIAEVSSEVPVKAGEILYPVKDAIYLINKAPNQRVKVITVSAFSETRLRLLKSSLQSRAKTLLRLFD